MEPSQACRKWGAPPHFWADQLALSQPGGHIIPIQYYVPPWIFRSCDRPDSKDLKTRLAGIMH